MFEFLGSQRVCFLSLRDDPPSLKWSQESHGDYIGNTCVRELLFKLVHVSAGREIVAPGQCDLFVGFHY